MNLVRARRELDRVKRGIGLTRRKREALVAELFRLARPAVDACAPPHRHPRSQRRGFVVAAQPLARLELPRVHQPTRLQPPQG